jgi:hypothetical protein
MNLLKLLAASAAVAVIVIAFRDAESGGWLAPAGLGTIDEEMDEDEEPILGYDGMDVDTLLDWLADAGLDGDTLERMRDYEETHLGREAVLSAIDERL